MRDYQLSEKYTSSVSRVDVRTACPIWVESEVLHGLALLLLCNKKQSKPQLAAEPDIRQLSLVRLRGTKWLSYWSATDSWVEDTRVLKWGLGTMNHAVVTPFFGCSSLNPCFSVFLVLLNFLLHIFHSILLLPTISNYHLPLVLIILLFSTFSNCQFAFSFYPLRYFILRYVYSLLHGFLSLSSAIHSSSLIFLLHPVFYFRFSYVCF